MSWDKSFINRIDRSKRVPSVSPVLLQHALNHVKPLFFVGKDREIPLEWSYEFHLHWRSTLNNQQDMVSSMHLKIKMWEIMDLWETIIKRGCPHFETYSWATSNSLTKRRSRDPPWCICSVYLTAEIMSKRFLASSFAWLDGDVDSYNN